METAGQGVSQSLTYKVSSHLLVLLKPASVTELQERVDMIGARLEQNLQVRKRAERAVGRTSLGHIREGGRPWACPSGIQTSGGETTTRGNIHDTPSSQGAGLM